MDTPLKVSEVDRAIIEDAFVSALGGCELDGIHRAVIDCAIEWAEDPANAHDEDEPALHEVASYLSVIRSDISGAIANIFVKMDKVPLNMKIVDDAVSAGGRPEPIYVVSNGLAFWMDRGHLVSCAISSSTGDPEWTHSGGVAFDSLDENEAFECRLIERLLTARMERLREATTPRQDLKGL